MTPEVPEPRSYQGWLLLPDGTYLDASDVVSVKPVDNGVELYTATMSFSGEGMAIGDVMAVVSRHRKSGPPAVPPGQQKKV